MLALLAVLAFVVSYRRKDTAQALGLPEKTSRREQRKAGKAVEAAARQTISPLDPPPAAPAVYIPPDPETLGVTRRQFLNRSIGATFGFSLSVLGIVVVQNLYPSGVGGFGAKINVGSISKIKDGIAAGNGFFYFPAGRMWITEYPAAALPKAETQYAAFYDQVEQGLSAGVVALFQTCPHLGCRVPECATSQWFECPCHGSQYNRVGEQKGGPAPRGMDRFPMTVNAKGELEVNTGTVIPGPVLGTNTTGQEAEGPNCLSDGGGH